MSLALTRKDGSRDQIERRPKQNVEPYALAPHSLLHDLLNLCAYLRNGLGSYVSLAKTETGLRRQNSVLGAAFFFHTLLDRSPMKAGFTINLSADDPPQADRLAAAPDFWTAG